MDDGNPCTVDTCVNGATVHTAGNAGVLCRVGATECDAAEYCKGTSAICPADAPAAPGTSCGGELGCGCNGAGACVQNGGRIEYCYDDSGTMQSVVRSPSGGACGATSCP